MLTTSYFTNRSETVMILHFCKLISTTYLTGQLEVVYLSTQPNVNLWLLQGKETRQLVTLGCHTIARVYQYTYFGVKLSADLSCDKHIHVLCTKAKKMLGPLYRSFYPNSFASSLLKLYISLIRSMPVRYGILRNSRMFALRLCVKQWDLVATFHL